jgi:thiamine pyrophosphokinase
MVTKITSNGEKNLMDWVVIAAGEMRNQRFWEGFLKSSEKPRFPILCADAGWQHCQKLALTPQTCVGDMDSCKDLPSHIDRLEFPSRKEQSDTQLAIATAFKRGAKQVWLLGGSGSRLDHTQANLKLLSLYPQKLTMLDGDYEITAIRGHHEFVANLGETVSLLPAGNESVTLTTQGLEFALHASQLRHDSHGLSNIVNQTKVRIEVHDGMVMLWRIWEPYSNRLQLVTS